MIIRKRQALVLPLLLMLAVTLAACGGNEPEAIAQEVSVPNGRSLEGISPVAGQLVPDFTLNTGSGSSFSLRSHRGEIILLYFSFPG